MSGFKRTIQEMKPVGFWTFDGEPVSPATRLYTHAPLTIYDESDVFNDGTLMADSSEANFAYRAGTGSLVSLELAQQSSLCFGYYGKRNSTYPKSFVYVPNISLYDTRANFGSYTVTFMYEKTADENVFRTVEYPTYHGWDLSRPVLSKPGLINIFLYDSFYSEDYMSFVFPSGAVNWYESASSVPLYGRKHFITARWDCIQTGDPLSPYVGVATVIVDGVTIGTRSASYADAPPDTYLNSTFEILGNSATAASFNDRATSATYIDQIAFFNRAVSNVDIWRLYKKCFKYEDLILRRGPSLYLPFNDNPDVITTAVTPLAGASYVTAYGQVVRGQDGPPNVPSSRAFLFADAMAQYNTKTWPYFPNSITLDVNKYCFCFWAKVGGNSRSVLFAMQGETKPFAGPLLELNVGNGGQFLNGGLQFSESENAWISTPPGVLFNEGAWLFITAQRRNDMLELYVNGELMASKSYARQGINGMYSNIDLMGTAPGKLYSSGYLSHFALFSGRTLEPSEVAMFHTYSRIYRARGSTTLRGAPYSARVRLYSYRTGALVQQKDSDPATGEYTFYLDNNELLTTQVLSMADRNVRVRGYGPITPGEMEDSP